MTPSLQVSDAADAFWAAADLPETFPRDIRQAITRTAPVSIVLLSALHVSRVEEWLERQGRPIAVSVTDRPLRACLIAQSGAGFVFVDGADPENEQRFSLAHEFAHFLLDYCAPRRRAIASLGDGILDVLDGRRQPSPDERAAALLAGATARRHIHLMGRDEGFEHADDIDRAEENADALAFELLAPWHVVSRHIEDLGLVTDSPAVTRLLVAEYGLPWLAAEQYAACLAPDSLSATALLRHLHSVELSNPVSERLVDGSSVGMQTP